MDCRGHGLDSSGPGQGLVLGCCEHSSEPSGFLKGREFCDQLSDCQILNKDSAPRC